MIDHHSSIAHSAYHDLLRSLKGERAARLGSPTREQRGQRAYWYETVRIGSMVRRRYIGEDTPELAADIARRAELTAQAKDRATHRSRLVRLLRGEDFLPVDGKLGSLLKAMADTGVFRLGGTLVGTQAFRLYEGELGIRYRLDDTAHTGDIDIAQFERLSLALGDQVEERLETTFKALDFDPVPSVQPNTVWKWRQARSDILIEFLTPSFRPDEDIRPLPALGVSAQSLHFLNYLIAQPIPAAVLYRSGVLVQIPQPERFAVHKLIVADRRRGGPDAIKARKDRAQAAFLIEVLAEDRPDDLREAHEDALSRGPQWRERIGRSLARMPRTQALLAAL